MTACVPADLEAFLLRSHRCGVMAVSYGPRGNPGVNDLGLVLRLQEAARGVVTRPVMVGRAPGLTAALTTGKARSRSASEWATSGLILDVIGRTEAPNLERVRGFALVRP